MHIRKRTFDDLLRAVFNRIEKFGQQVLPVPSKGGNKELFGVVLELTQPRARLSRTEDRGVIFSALGELCWYLAGSNDLSFIQYYIRRGYEADGNTGKVWGGYGPRIFNRKKTNQFTRIRKLLLKQPSSRRAVIQIFDANDLVRKHKDIPCTCTMQFLVRNNLLHMYVSMRSNDAYLGLPHDVFAFTMIQELMARELGVGLGRYKHAAGSLHLYDIHQKKMQYFLDEDWQEAMSMPQMPDGSQRDAIEIVIDVERRLRFGEDVDIDALPLKNYWKDILKLLRIFSLTRDSTDFGDRREAIQIGRTMSSGFYDGYIRARAERLRRRQESAQLDLELKRSNLDESER
ncbi:MAG TPA: thymidylate synthase [Stellaceae bacterium]|jgi:thymidylate synthase|nr:thymidylate synthase [Stellaceae bacterium]